MVTKRLRSFTEVTKLYNAMHPVPISRTQCFKECHSAEAKLRAVLEELAGELGIPEEPRRRQTVRL